MFDKLKTFFDEKTEISELKFDSDKIAVVALLISTAKSVSYTHLTLPTKA